MNHHTSKGFPFHKDVFLHHPPWNLYQLSTIFCQGVPLPHLLCRVVPNSAAGGDEPMPHNHLCSQTIPSANCMRLQTVIQVSHLWKERHKEGELDKNSIRLQHSSKKSETSPMSSAWTKSAWWRNPTAPGAASQICSSKTDLWNAFHGLHITLTSVCSQKQCLRRSPRTSMLLYPVVIFRSFSYFTIQPCIELLMLLKSVPWNTLSLTSLTPPLPEGQPSSLVAHLHACPPLLSY